MKTLIVLLILAFSMTGCGTKIVYVDRPIEVAVPQEVKLQKVQKPERGRNRVEYLLNNFKYRDTLEAVVREHN